MGYPPEMEGMPGTVTNPLRALGTIQEIAERVKSGKWSTLDLESLADFVIGKSAPAPGMTEPVPSTAGETASEPHKHTHDCILGCKHVSYQGSFDSEYADDAQPTPEAAAVAESNAVGDCADLSEAFRIAVEVHGNQRDKSGAEPYMAHICRVASWVETDKERVVAILHDVLEDIQIPNHNVEHRILDTYGACVLAAVQVLTRNPDTPYLEYIRRVAQNPLATKVKLADLQDNMREDRLVKLPPVMAIRLRKKYAAAFIELCSAASIAPAATHVTKEWDKDWNPICVPNCPACAAAAVSKPVWIGCPMCGTRFANATGTAHDLSLRKPSAEGDGWIAVTPETMPQVGLIVDVYQLYGWAKWTGTEWIAVDRCGNESCLMWTPKYWVYRPLPAPPSGQGKKA